MHFVHKFLVLTILYKVGVDSATIVPGVVIRKKVHRRGCENGIGYRCHSGTYKKKKK